MFESKLKAAKEILEIGNILAKWGVLVIGMFCLLYYSNQIGHLPEGISLGEGFAFYLISIGFMIAYALYAIVSSSLGSWLISYFAGWSEKRAKQEKDQRPRNTNYALMRHPLTYGFGICGIIATAFTATRDIHAATQFFAASMMQGFMIASLMRNQTELNLLSSQILLANEPVDKNGICKDEMAQRRRLTHKAIWMVIFVLPLIMAPNKGFIVDAAFRVAKLRKENATIQIKLEWAERIRQTGLKDATSFLGENYRQFEKVNVSLRSMGTKVILELPGKEKDGAPIQLPIPSDSIFIE